MMEPFDIFFNFIPPILIFITGYLLSIFIFRDFEDRHLIEKYLISLTMGFFIFVFFPVIWNIVVNHSLSLFYVVFTIVVVIIDCLLFFNHFAFVKQEIVSALRKTKELMKDNILKKTCLLFYLLFIIKILFSLSIRPLDDSDAVRQYLPLASDFTELGGIGSYLGESIGSILINSWSFSVFGFSSEPFRLIPSILLMSFPLLAFFLTNHFLKQKYAYVALVISCFSPFFDNAINLAYYPDIFATTFVMISIIFLLKPRKLTNSLIVGFALTLAFYLKSSYAYVGAITLIACIGFKGKIKAYIVSSLLLLSIFAYSWPSLQKLQIYDTLDLMQLMALGLIVIIYSTPYIKKINNTENTRERLCNILYLLMPLFLTIVLCVPWKLRQFYIGGGFLDALTSSAHDYWREFWVFTGHLTKNYDFFMFLHNPALNIYLTIAQVVGLIACFFNDKTRKIGFFFLVNYFIFFVPFATSPTYRHFLIGYFFLLPLASIGLLAILRKFVGNLTPKIIVIYLLPFAFFSTLQHQSFNLFFNQITYQNNLLFSVIDSIRVTNFFAKSYSQIGNLTIVIIIAAILTFVTALILREREFILSRKFKRFFIYVILFGFAFSMLLLPVIQHAYVQTDGNLFAYEYAGSSYKHEISIAQEINEFTDKNDVILTFYFTAVYYLDARAIELNSPKLMPAIESNDIGEILTTFKELGITHVMIPTPLFWYKRYSDFVGFSEKSNMFRILSDSGCMMPLINEQGEAYDVYTIQYVNSSYLKMTGFCNGALYPDETHGSYSYYTISNEKYVIKSGDILQYYVMLPNGNPEFKAGVELYFFDDSKLSDFNLVDQNGLQTSPSTDLSSNVKSDGIITNIGNWYRRTIVFPAELIGKEISHIDIAFEGDSRGIYTTYYWNIKIVNENGHESYIGNNNHISTSILKHREQGYFGVIFETVNPPLKQYNMSLDVIQLMNLATFDSLEKWQTFTYLSNITSISLDINNKVEGTASVKVNATNLLSNSAITLENQYFTPQNWTEMKLLNLDVKLEMRSINISATLRLIIRDDAGQSREYWFSPKLIQWQKIIFDLANPSYVSSEELNLERITKIQIQIRNWNKLTIPYLTLWVDNLYFADEVKLERILPAIANCS